MPDPAIHLPGLIPANAGGRKSYVLAVNKSAATLYGTKGRASGSDVCILDFGAGLQAQWDDTLPVPVTTTTSADSVLAAGVVAENESTVPVGGKFWLQVGGLHNSVQIDGTTDIAFGDPVGTHTAAGVADKSAGTGRDKLGIFASASYTTDAVAAKRVLLLNPQGFRPA
jgi:hypothetical protein